MGLYVSEFLKQASHCECQLAARSGAQGRWTEQQRRYPRKRTKSQSDKSGFGQAHGASDYRHKAKWSNSAIHIGSMRLLILGLYLQPAGWSWLDHPAHASHMQDALCTIHDNDNDTHTNTHKHTRTHTHPNTHTHTPTLGHFQRACQWRWQWQLLERDRGRVRVTVHLHCGFGPFADEHPRLVPGLRRQTNRLTVIGIELVSWRKREKKAQKQIQQKWSSRSSLSSEQRSQHFSY